jgi:hypothetical protein
MVYRVLVHVVKSGEIGLLVGDMAVPELVPDLSSRGVVCLVDGLAVCM